MSTPDEMRRLFDVVLTSPPPDTTDIDAAMRSGRRRRRRRPAAVLVSLGVVLVAAGIIITTAWDASVPQSPTAAPTTQEAASSENEGRLVTSASELHGLWHTIELDGQDVSDVVGGNGEQLIAQFGDDQGGPWWAANDGCNETRGRFTITPTGRFTAEAIVMTEVGCVDEYEYYPRNPAAVIAADEARIMDATDTEPRRLSLLSGEKVIAVYVLQSEATAP